MSKAYDILGVVSPSALAIATSEKSDVPLAKLLLPGLAGGLAGLTIWNQHPVLGFVLGDSLGLNAYRIYRGEGKDRTLAACNIGAASCGVAASLYFSKHPFWGFLLGFAVGNTITAFVPGSNASKLMKTEK